MKPGTASAAAATSTTPPPKSHHSRDPPRPSPCAAAPDGEVVAAGRVLAVWDGICGAAPSVASLAVGAGLLSIMGALTVISFSADPGCRFAPPVKVAISFPVPTAAVPGIST